MKRLSDSNEPIVRVPVILEVVEVQIPLAIIVPEIRNVTVAIPVLPHRTNVQDIARATIPRIFSGLNLIRNF